ncbi:MULTISPECIES: co-chaperone YbbN [Paraburkholderia]|uniref:thioredoxin family protein n=1 Tax=Paraburkholderia TaxID=1822464 RepID=UPI00224EFC07|nr:MULTISPECIES: thioredoxin family protein [Paraburkholderia]MCX4165045.1 thioredoxin family protein [Paraburkholderia megapolitana]MDN7160538.1 thioredoxin family protein [Paraburkholderia sp. CHISQ3]MDQ6497585.1 thioredoxin family protein [Paraburkholderia megapolitana]
MELKAGMTTQVLDTTDAKFEIDVAHTTSPVLLYFWAPWSEPCGAIDPLLDQVARHHTSRLKIVRVNVDEHEAIVKRFDIHRIPTVLFFDKGDLHTALVAPSVARVQVLIEDRFGSDMPWNAARADELCASSALAFQGQAARKKICLKRLRDTVFSAEHPPSRCAAGDTGHFVDEVGVPGVLGDMIDTLWRLTCATEGAAYARARTIALIEAIPLGADLSSVAPAVTHGLLHDRRWGLVRYAPEGNAREIFARLAVLHARELIGTRVDDRAWLELARDAIALADVHSLRQSEDTATPLDLQQIFIEQMEHVARPLARLDLDMLLQMVLSLTYAREQPRFWTDEDERNTRMMGDAALREVERQCGLKPPDDDIETVNRWRHQVRTLIDKLEATQSTADPTTSVRLEIWKSHRDSLAAELYSTVCELMVSRFDRAPKTVVLH